MGLDDHRSHSLYFILSYAWFMQANAVVLECVDNVTQFAQTQECIDKFARDATNWSLTSSTSGR